LSDAFTEAFDISPLEVFTVSVKALADEIKYLVQQAAFFMSIWRGTTIADIFRGAAAPKKPPSGPTPTSNVVGPTPEELERLKAGRKKAEADRKEEADRIEAFNNRLTELNDQRIAAQEKVKSLEASRTEAVQSQQFGEPGQYASHAIQAALSKDETKK